MRGQFLPVYPSAKPKETPVLRREIVIARISRSAGMANVLPTFYSKISSLQLTTRRLARVQDPIGQTTVQKVYEYLFKENKFRLARNSTLRRPAKHKMNALYLVCLYAVYV